MVGFMVAIGRGWSIELAGDVDDLCLPAGACLTVRPGAELTARCFSLAGESGVAIGVVGGQCTVLVDSDQARSLLEQLEAVLR